MEEQGPDFKLNFTDPEINKMIQEAEESPLVGTKHFSQNEEFFIQLNENYDIPPMPIHHDVRTSTPSPEYLNTIRSILKTLIQKQPVIFRNLTYFFDPADILKPSFFQLYKLGEVRYLYLLKIDLSFHPGFMEIVSKENNDHTPYLRTDKLFLSALLLPLSKVYKVNDRIKGFDVDKKISDTWVGETGRGYFVKGIWIDNELTKFFSKLFLPEAIRTYPYYPYRCIYRTVTQEVLHPTPQRRKQLLPYLHKAIAILDPNLDLIQKSIKAKGYEPSNPVYQKLKKAIPHHWNKLFGSLTVETYLNDNEQREFKVDEGLES